MEIDTLRSRLEEKEKEKTQAVEVGQMLLRSNEELNERLTELSAESTQKIDELQQEKYSLQQRLECQRADFQALKHDVDTARTDLIQEHQMRERRLTETHTRTVRELEQLVSDLRGDNERLETQLDSSRVKVAGLELKVKSMKEEEKSADVRGESFYHPELAEIEKMCRQERSEKEEALAKLASLKEDNQLLQMAMEDLSVKVERLTEECQERTDQSNQWFKALEGSKERVMELNAELDSLKMDAGQSRGTSGNSLFGEVDDRRLQVERKYVSLQVKHDSLEKCFTTMSQQYKRLKAEMSSLLCRFSVVGADAAHVQRLDMALRQAQSEKEALQIKLQRLEKQQASMLASHEKIKYVAAYGEKKEYIALIESQLNIARRENATLTKEVELKGRQLIWETQKLSRTEVNLHHKEQDMARVQKEFSVIKLKMQDWQEKLEKAESGCKQQEAQVKLLERELERQRKCRGGSSRRHSSNVQQSVSSTTNTPPSSATTSTSVSTATSSSVTASSSSSSFTTKQDPGLSIGEVSSLADELASCHGTGGGGRVNEPGDSDSNNGGKQKENKQLNSTRRGGGMSKTAAFNFLEDFEKEFDKRASLRAAEKRAVTSNIYGNKPEPVVGGHPPVSHTTTIGTRRQDSKVTQCPQQ